MEWPFDVKAFLKNLSKGPGVYVMMGAEEKVLYVGKARNLQRRVGSYFLKGAHATKTLVMLSKVQRVDINRTRTETEALLLESNLIKQHRPRYNVMLRDDKSYPYLYIATDDEYPRISFYRGSRSGKGQYFGPYPSAASVRETIQHLQQLFLLRPCDDTTFKNRSRPCLQHQIERCSAPCVKAIDSSAYKADLDHAMLFLQGRNEQVLDKLGVKMNTAAESLEYEAAGRYRDQIKILRRMQEQQNVTDMRGDADVVGMAMASGSCSVAVLFIRGGRNLGHRSYYPNVPKNAEPQEVMTAFLNQYYDRMPAPNEIIVAQEPEDTEWLQTLFGERIQRKVQIKHNVRAGRAKWLELANMTAQQALSTHLTADAAMRGKFDALQQAFQLDTTPERLECFDISHHMGEGTVASCVVFDSNGAKKTDYRRFGIKTAVAGDDYQAIAEALERRYKRVLAGESPRPDIVFVDGGKGQTNRARAVLNELGLHDLLLCGVAKGPKRRAGEEMLYISPGMTELILPSDSPALHLIQQIRDESHRFAITGMRAKRAKKRNESTLQNIPGLGAKRRQALLTRFGGLQEINKASASELAATKGISEKLAKEIYQYLHND